MKHAVLGASSAYRWLACTPSARLEEGFPNQSSPYAEEGTFAHALAELELTKHFTAMKPSAYKKKYAAMCADPLYSKGLEEYIDDYCTIVAEHYSEAKAHCADPEILFEQHVDFSEWVPGGYGTSDVVIIADGTLEVIDLKFGEGVVVSAVNNPQIRLYALGALSEFGCLYDIHNVKMTICQIRVPDGISSETMPVEDLIFWAKSYVAPRAKFADVGTGDFVPGEHCKFCRARATCRARAEENLKLAKYEFKAGPLLGSDEIADILTRAKGLTTWANDINAYALDQAVNHDMQYSGYKLVEGRSVRKYKNELEVAKALEGAGYPEASIYQKSLYGITAMEKAVGKKTFNELLSDLIVKPEGKPALVPETDKRPALNSVESAKKDFEGAI